MNSIGKILVIFVTACSMGFLAFVVAFRSGGPDWLGEMRSADLQKEFVFATEPGEKITYSARHRRTDTEVSPKTPILAEAVLKSRKRLEDDANKKLQELSPQVQPLTERLALIKKLIPEDDAGVQARVKKYEEQIEKLVSQLKQVGDEFSIKTLETQDVMRLAQDRREEGYRLANQLELLRNDKFAALQQQKVLEFELIRLEENRQRLQRRQKQLKQQLGDKYDDSK
jgi:chromosome segregation ATPase